MSKFDQLTEAYIKKVVLKEADGMDHGKGYAVDVYLRRQGNVREVKQDLFKKIHRAVLSPGAYAGDNFRDENDNTEALVGSSANVIPYKRSNENDSSVLELTFTGVSNPELLKMVLDKVVSPQFKYDIYPVNSSI
ncbi:MAG: hypothetical protein EB127_08205 [Alphaproteobacteria bacterium]|nr:hypothetical protein [Alphaproteobacteria bacterium]